LHRVLRTQPGDLPQWLHPADVGRGCDDYGRVVPGLLVFAGALTAVFAVNGHGQVPHAYSWIMGAAVLPVALAAYVAIYISLEKARKLERKARTERRRATRMRAKTLWPAGRDELPEKHPECRLESPGAMTRSPGSIIAAPGA
jgi:hypothetical protein